ncbi:MAG TPA: flagellar motor protein MotB [Planctomycetaceae bacterium]|nr:flagellar motor protein MotB [Planctomycetaceae bacterium]
MAGGGGAWKVAYADFVTAMMAFFMVMWLTSQNKAVKESIAQYFENPLGVAKEARATSIHGIEGASALAALQGEQAGPHGSDKRDASNAEGDGGGKPPLIRIFDDLGRSRTSGTMVLFDEGATELNTQARDQIKALAPQLMGKPNKIELRGHASKFDLATSGPDKFKDSWSLCYARCLATKTYLTELGIEAARIRLSQDGDFEPYSEHKDEVWRAMNSRVEIFSVSEFAYDFKPTAEERAGRFKEYVAPPQPAADSHGDDHAEEKEDGHGGGHGAAKSSGHGAAKSGGHGTAKDSGHGAKGGGHGAEKASGHGAKSSGHGAEKASGHGAKSGGHGAPAKKSGH